MAQAIAIAPNVSALAVQLNAFDMERKKTVLEVDKLKERLYSLKGKGSLEVDINEFMILIQWAVFTNMQDTDRNKIRKVISVIVDKTDGCITIKIKYHFKDEWLVFGGTDRKPHWAFKVEFSSVDNVSIRDEGFLTTSNLPLFNKAVEQLDKIEQSYLDLFNTANEMLEVVGYSEISGASFWPNTGKYDRVDIVYEGNTYSIALNGRVPKDIATALESTGLTRKEFIERYRIDKI